MAFTTKDWQDAPSTATPISAAALEDMETRLAAYADTVGAITVTNAPYNVNPGVTSPAATAAGINQAITDASVRAATAGGIVDVILPGNSSTIYTVDITEADPGSAVAAAVFMRSNVRLRAPGNATIKLKDAVTLPGSATVGQIVSNVNPFPANLGESQQDIIVEGVTIDGNANNQVLTGGNPRVLHGLFFGGVRRSLAMNCLVKNVQGNSNVPPGETFHYEFNHCHTATAINCESDGSGATDTATGFSANYSYDVAWIRCRSHHMSWGHGYTHWQCSSVKHVACHAYLCSGVGSYGFNSERSEDVHYNGCSAGGRSPLVVGGPTQPLWWGSQTSLACTRGIVIAGSSNVNLTGCNSTYNGINLRIESNAAFGGQPVRNCDGVFVNGGDYRWSTSIASGGGIAGLGANFSIVAGYQPNVFVRGYFQDTSDALITIANAPLEKVVSMDNTDGMRWQAGNYGTTASDWAFRWLGNGGVLFFGVNATGQFVARDPDDLASGEETIPRISVNTNGLTMTSQSVRLAYFTAAKNETVTQIRVVTGGTGAGATPTLVRFGLYSVAANGALTLVASTPNDTALLATASTTYSKALSVSYAKVAGQRYALGILVVTAAAAPTVYGAGPLVGSEMAVAPRKCASVGGQADLPASVAAGSLSDTTVTPYLVVLP